MGYIWIKLEKILSFWKEIISFNEINLIKITHQQRNGWINKCTKNEQKTTIINVIKFWNWHKWLHAINS
jgi:hypothetical protein